MNRPPLLSALIIAVFACSSCSTTTEQAPSSPAPIATMAAGASGNGEQEVTRLEQEWIEANVKKDKAWFERHFADEFIDTTSQGKLKGKAQLIAVIESKVGCKRRARST
jgi:hypothetical protein